MEAHHEIDEDMRTRKKPYDIDCIFRLILILIPLGVLGNVIFSLVTTDFESLALLERFSVPLFMVAVLLSFVPWLTYTIRLGIWLKFLGIPHSLRTVFRINLGHELGGAISPAVLGGAPVKAGMLMQMGVPSGKSLSLMCIGTIEEWTFNAIVIPLLVTIFALWDLPILAGFVDFLTSPYTICTAAAVVVVILACILADRMGWKFVQGNAVYRYLHKKFSKGISDFTSVFIFILKEGKFRFAFCSLLASIGWMARLMTVAFLVMSLGMEADCMRFVALQWIIYNASLVLPTPGAAVGAEALFFMLFKPYIAAEAMGVVTAGWRFLTFYLVNIVASVLFLVTAFDPMKRRSKPCSVKVEATEK
jgi:uncharacterized protein (TIRG00374 family)